MPTPPFVTVGDVMRYDIVTASVLHQCRMTFHARCTVATGGLVEYEELANLIDAAVRPACRAMMVDTTFFEYIEIARLTPLPQSDFKRSSAGVIANLVAQDELPRMNCGIITKKTGIAGKRFRGRVYVPHAGEADNFATAQPTAGYMALMTTLANLTLVPRGYVGGAGNVQIDPVLYHRTTRTYNDITAFQVRPYWATQRRRNRHPF